MFIFVEMTYCTSFELYKFLCFYVAKKHVGDVNKSGLKGAIHRSEFLEGLTKIRGADGR